MRQSIHSTWVRVGCVFFAIGNVLFVGPPLMFSIRNLLRSPISSEMPSHADSWLVVCFIIAFIAAMLLTLRRMRHSRVLFILFLVVFTGFANLYSAESLKTFECAEVDYSALALREYWVLTLGLRACAWLAFCVWFIFTYLRSQDAERRRE